MVTRFAAYHRRHPVVDRGIRRPGSRSERSATRSRRVARRRSRSAAPRLRRRRRSLPSFRRRSSPPEQVHRCRGRRLGCGRGPRSAPRSRRRRLRVARSGGTRRRVGRCGCRPSEPGAAGGSRPSRAPPAADSRARIRGRAAARRGIDLRPVDADGRHRRGRSPRRRRTPGNGAPGDPAQHRHAQRGRHQPPRGRRARPGATGARPPGRHTPDPGEAAQPAISSSHPAATRPPAPQAAGPPGRPAGAEPGRAAAEHGPGQRPGWRQQVATSPSPAAHRGEVRPRPGAGRIRDPAAAVGRRGFDRTFDFI